MKLKTLKDIINQWSKEMKTHLSQFGKGRNRDIDTREKGTMTITPIVIEKRIKQEAIKYVKDKTIRTTWSAEEFIEKFFNFTEEELTSNNQNKAVEDSQ